MKKLKRFACIVAVLYTAVIIGVIPSPAAGKPPVSPDSSGLVHSFVVEDKDGRRMDVARQKNKVIFINFWALTCIPCKAEMPTINNLATHYKDDSNFLVLPVDLDHHLLEDISYFNDRKFTLNVYMPAGVVPQALFMGELPTTVVIDKAGRIALFRQGEGRYDSSSFFQLIDSLLRK